MAINFPNSPSVNDIHVSGANRWQWNGSSWTRIGGISSDADVINSSNDNSTTTLYPVMVSGTGSQNAKIATSANKNLKFNAAEGDLTVGGDISGINANLTGILTASQYNSITAPGVNVTGVATALQLKGPLTSSGINVTGVSTFSGNVTVGGILTYEDVKNVDSIGLGTFRNGVVVKTGTATTALIVEGDARITGILTVGTGSLVITDKDINATGIITGANFKSGTTNVHNVGVEAAGINVLGADTPIGTGATVYNSGLFVGKQGAEFQGVVTATRFVGSGVSLTDVISGIGIGTESGIVGYAATIVHFKGPGVSTAYYSATTGVGTVYFTGGGGSASVSISESAPSSPSAGDMWWDSDVGNLQIYYTDANSSQWVTANNSGPTGAQGVQGAQGATGAQGHQGRQGAVGAQGAQGHQGVQGAQGHQGRQGSVGIASLTISTSAPSSPAQGDMWWDSDDSTLGLYYNDGSSSQWVNINHGPSGPQGAAGAQGAQGHQGVQGTAGASITINNNTSTRFITATGSATSLDGESNLTYNNSLVTFASSSLLVDKSSNPTISAKETSGNKEVQLRADTTGGLLRTAGSYPLVLGTNQTERLRITSGGDVLIGRTSTNTSHALCVQADGGAEAIVICGRSADDIGELSFFENDSSTRLGELQYRQDHVNFRHRVGDIRFCTAGASERLRIDTTGRLLINQTTGSSKLCVSSTSEPVVAEFHHSNGGTNSQARISLGALANNPPSNRGVNVIAENNGAGHDFVVACSPSHSGGPTEAFRVHSNGDITVPSGSIKLSESGQGINFHNFGSGSGVSSNILDDYEEGSFTPVFNGSDGGGTSRSGTGKYTKVGNVVNCWVDLSNANGSSFAGGYMKVTGFPFTCTQQSWSTNIWTYNVGFDSDRRPLFYMPSSATHCNAYYSRDDATWQPWYISQWDASQVYARFHITYLA